MTFGYPNFASRSLKFISNFLVSSLNISLLCNTRLPLSSGIFVHGKYIGEEVTIISPGYENACIAMAMDVQTPGDRVIQLIYMSQLKRDFIQCWIAYWN